MLRDSYPGHHSLTNEELEKAWKEGQFVLDTNVLLGLYRYDAATTNELLDVLSGIASRLWMPYQVGLEYNRRRLSVIAGEKRAFDKAITGVTDAVNKMGAIFEERSRNPHPSAKLAKQLLAIGELGDAMIAEVRKLGASLPDVHEVDSIRDGLSAYFDAKIGDPPTEEWLQQTQDLAKKRFEQGIPPGLSDDRKEEAFTDRGLVYEAKFGDAILWQQILDEAKTRNWPALILVTDDAKGDWWHVESGKTIGPRAELREEIARVSSVPLFHMYSSAQFLENAKRFAGAKVSKSSIELVRETVSRIDENSDAGRQIRIARHAISRWIKSTIGGGANVREVPFTFDLIVSNGGSNYGVVVKMMSGGLGEDHLGPYEINTLLKSIASSAVDVADDATVDHIELFLVFPSLRAVEQSTAVLGSIVSRVTASYPNVKVRSGTLMRAKDGNQVYVPTELGVFG